MKQYFEQMVLSASPAELIRLLYQKAIASTRSALDHMRSKRIAERCAAINNAYLVISELAASLRPEEAPELAARLSGLYTYIQARLLEANMQKQEEPLSEVLSLLITLGEAWEKVSDTRQANPKAWAAVASGSEEMERIAISA